MVCCVYVCEGVSTYLTVTCDLIVCGCDWCLEGVTVKITMSPTGRSHDNI